MSNDPLKFYTAAELQSVWVSAVDTHYAAPYLAAGDGGGFEIYTQAFKVLSIVSKAVERSLEACYILPHSGQTSEPAQGGAKARVMIRVTRGNDIHKPLLFSAGTFIEQYANDYGETGTTEVQTNRRFKFLSNLVFNPGEIGPLYVEVEAENIGYGYNYCYPNTLNTLVQPGVGFENEHGTVEITPGKPTPVLITANESDVIIPQHIGQTIEFVDGANIGTITRVIGYEGPNLNATPPHGGKALLESIWIIETSITGVISEGEHVRQDSTGSQGVVMRISENGPSGKSRIAISQSNGQFQLGAGLSIVGDMNGGLINCDNVFDPEIAVIYETLFVAETNTASWRIMSWSEDWFVDAYNEESPEGGKAASLDQLGAERNVYRVNGESDDNYRKRIAEVADTITPNAIKRAVNKIARPLNVEMTVREPPGFESMPGFYFDHDAFDYDPSLNENDRFKWLFDFTEFRAFILIQVPQLGYGEFGFAFDDYPAGYFDSLGETFDGFPSGEPAVYKQVYAKVDESRAGGVGFMLYRKD